MKDFRESQLPIMLEEVGTEGESARIRVLGRDRRTPEIVLAGGEIGGTGLQLVKAERKFRPSKMGDGQPLDVSQVTVVDRATGQRHRIVRNATANSSQPAAFITVGEGNHLYEVREGDEFIAGDARPSRYRVLDVRPTQVVLENLDTRETATLARSYARCIGSAPSFQIAAHWIKHPIACVSGRLTGLPAATAARASRKSCSVAEGRFFPSAANWLSIRPR